MCGAVCGVAVSSLCVPLLLTAALIVALSLAMELRSSAIKVPTPRGLESPHRQREARRYAICSMAHTQGDIRPHSVPCTMLIPLSLCGDGDGAGCACGCVVHGARPHDWSGAPRYRDVDQPPHGIYGRTGATGIRKQAHMHSTCIQLATRAQGEEAEVGVPCLVSLSVSDV
jgi:hypothetical protein